MLSKELDHVLSQEALENENVTSRQSELKHMMETLLTMLPNEVRGGDHQAGQGDEADTSPQEIEPNPSLEGHSLEPTLLEIPPLEGSLLDCFLFPALASIESPGAIVNPNLCIRLGVTLALLSVIASLFTSLLVAIVLLSRKKESSRV